MVWYDLFSVCFDYELLICYGMVWYGMVWCGVVWCGVVWCGMAWYGMWYGMVLFATTCQFSANLNFHPV